MQNLALSVTDAAESVPMHSLYKYITTLIATAELSLSPQLLRGNFLEHFAWQSKHGKIYTDQHRCQHVGRNVVIPFES